MTRKTTDELIESLAQGLRPVRVLPSPGYRALAWLGAVALLLAVFIWRKADLGAFGARESDPRMVLETAAMLMTGITAVASAFWLSVPGSAYAWRYLALPFLAVWIGASGVGCLHFGLGLGPPGERLGESTHCFVFIVALSLPLGATLLAMLRRARPLEPLPVALTAALGVSAVAAFALRFFHPFDITLIDLTTHFAAMAVVVTVAMIARRLLVPA